MINSKQDLRKYLKIELDKKYAFPYRLKFYLFPSTFSYLYFLRLTEYYTNNTGFFSSLKRNFYNRMLMIHGLFLGLTIPVNVCEEGLFIPHRGSIVINGSAHIGKNCCIQNNVNIGANGHNNIPTIGDNVYIGPGAVIYGRITIADNSWIGANAVVNKSIEHPNSIVAGVPAKFIRYSERVWWEDSETHRKNRTR